MVETQTLQPIPYLTFNGNCVEALDFYAELFGGKVVGKTTYGEIQGGCQIPEESKDSVANEMLQLPGGAMLYGGDVPSGCPYNPMTGLMLTLNFPTVDQAQKVFDGLAESGEVILPFEPSYQSEKFGIVVDKYRVHWAVNGKLLVRRG